LACTPDGWVPSASSAIRVKRRRPGVRADVSGRGL